MKNILIFCVSITVPIANEEIKEDCILYKIDLYIDKWRDSLWFKLLKFDIKKNFYVQPLWRFTFF